MLSHFYHDLLAKAIPAAGPDSRGEEIDSNLRWENVQSHISRGMDAGGGGVGGVVELWICRQSTSGDMMVFSFKTGPNSP